jgi:hypothetical protein
VCDFADCEETQAVCGAVKCESAGDIAASGTVCTSVQSDCQETVDTASKSPYYSYCIYILLSIMSHTRLLQLNSLKPDFYCSYLNVLVSALIHSTISGTFADEQSEYHNDTEVEAGQRTPENAADIIK